LDADDLEPILRLPTTDPSDAGFHSLRRGESVLWFDRGRLWPPGVPKNQIELYSSRTGELRATVKLSIPLAPRFGHEFSQDAARLVIVAAPLGQPTNAVVYVYDVATSKELFSHPSMFRYKPTFFPNSHRLFADDGESS